MKKILKYTKDKKNTYIVTLEDEKIRLYDDIIIKYELLLKKKISSIELRKIKEENHKLNSYYESLKYLNRKMRTEKEIKEKLLKEHYSKEVISETITKLKKENWLNDENYIKCYLHDTCLLSLDGPEKIKRKLINLGVGKDLIDKYLNEIDEKIWKEKINKMIKKKVKENRKESEEMWKRKLGNYLVYNGYPKELWIEELSRITLEKNDNIIKKEKEKLEIKLSKKYEGKELIYKIKMKLYQKGFKEDEIEQLF